MGKGAIKNSGLFQTYVEEHHITYNERAPAVRRTDDKKRQGDLGQDNEARPTVDGSNISHSINLQ